MKGLEIALAISAFVIAGCGSDPSAPRISLLRIAPSSGVRPAETVTATVDYQDDDSDVAGGNAEIGLKRREAPEGELFKVKLAGGDASAHGTITMTVKLPGGAIPGRYDLAVTVIDSAGRRSNPLVGEFTVLN